MNNNHKIALAIIFLCSLIKLTVLGKPIFDGAGGKQIQTASMAQNIIREGYDPAKIYSSLSLNKDETEIVPRILLNEGPIYHLLAIATSNLFQIELGSAGRLISIFCFAGSAYYFWLLLNLLLPEISALISLFLYCFYPVTLIFSKTFQVEGLMMLCIIGAIYNFLVWVENDNKFNLSFVIIFCSIGFITKQYTLYIYLPFLWFLIRKHNYSLLKEKTTYTFLIPLFPVFLWTYYSFMQNLNMPHGDWNLSNWLLKEIFNYNWYRDLLILQIQSFTPLFLTTGLLGLFLKKANKTEFFMYLWLISIVVFLLLVSDKALHDYYQIHHSPLVAYFSGKLLGSIYISDWFENNLSKNKLFIAIGISTVLIMIVGYSLSGFLIPAHMTPGIKKLGQKIESITTEKDILLTGYGDGLLFYSNRPGIVMVGITIEKLELLRRLGVTYYVQGKRSYERILGNSKFKEYLLNNYNLIEMKEGDYAVFDLRKKTVG